MTSLASTTSPPSFGLFRVCCRRSEPAPPWLLLSLAPVLPVLLYAVLARRGRLTAREVAP